MFYTITTSPDAAIEALAGYVAATRAYDVRITPVHLVSWGFVAPYWRNVRKDLRDVEIHGVRLDIMSIPREGWRGADPSSAIVVAWEADTTRQGHAASNLKGVSWADGRIVAPASVVRGGVEAVRQWLYATLQAQAAPALKAHLTKL